MPVTIRLSRIGTKHVPFYRVVVVDSRKKRDGAVKETIGTYDALKTQIVTFKPERYDAWIKVGAQPTDSAKKVYKLFKKLEAGAPVETPKTKKAEAAKKTVKKEDVSEVEKPAETKNEETVLMASEKVEKPADVKIEEVQEKELIEEPIKKEDA